MKKRKKTGPAWNHAIDVAVLAGNHAFPRPLKQLSIIGILKFKIKDGA
jgi:hypothetical protein